MVSEALGISVQTKKLPSDAGAQQMSTSWQVILEEPRQRLPKSIEIVERDTHAEDPEFVRERLIEMSEAGS